MTTSYVCWQPLLTDHQAYTYAALRRAVGGDLVVNVGRLNDTVRAAQGWVGLGDDELEKRLIPSTRWRKWARQEFERHPDAVHLFGSPFEEFRQIQIMSMACRLGRKVALISEPFSNSSTGYLSDGARALGWIKARLRPLLYRAYGFHFSGRIDAVFAISPRACDQYAALGVPAARIFPFGYFVPGKVEPMTRMAGQDRCELRLVFVGSLIARKGLSLAIGAVRRLREEGCQVTLNVYGAGDPAAYDFGDGTTYKGALPFGQAGEIIARHDALVLPSLFDGWGVVVNEALQAGTPVCCSDAVGAGAVVRAHGAGTIFSSENETELVRVLRQWIDDPARLDANRAAAVRVAPLLEPAVAGSYIQQAMAAADGYDERPEPAWYSWPGESRK